MAGLSSGCGWASFMRLLNTPNCHGVYASATNLLFEVPSPSRGGLGWGWFSPIRRLTTIPLLTSPFKGEGRLRMACAALVLTFGLSVTPAHAKCADITGSGNINIVGNAFPVLQHISRAMEDCKRRGLSVAVKMTPEARQETERAFGSGGVSAFDAAVVSMGAYSVLRSKGQLQSMTDLVAKYRARYNIEDRMLVKFNSEVMAIAFMQNTQNLYYRADLFDKHRLAVPTTFDAVGSSMRAARLAHSTPIAALPC